MQACIPPGDDDPRHVDDLGKELTTGFAGRLIRRTVYRISGGLGLSPSDRDELEQDLRAELFHRARRFDPRRGAWPAFAQAVVDRCGHTLWNRCRRRQRPESLDGTPDDFGSAAERVSTQAHDRRMGTRTRSDIERFDLAHDVACVMQKLSDEDAELCRRAMESSVAGAARQSKRARSTFRDHLARLRDVFVDHDLDRYL